MFFSRFSSARSIPRASPSKSRFCVPARQGVKCSASLGHTSRTLIRSIARRCIWGNGDIGVPSQHVRCDRCPSRHFLADRERTRSHISRRVPVKRPAAWTPVAYPRQAAPTRGRRTAPVDQPASPGKTGSQIVQAAPSEGSRNWRRQSWVVGEGDRSRPLSRLELT